MRTFRLGAALLLLFVGERASAGESVRAPKLKGEWLKLETANFTLYSDASESRTRDVGLELERLRAALALLTKPLSVNSPLPTTVLVFKNESSMDPYKPLVGGKPANISGYFLEASDGNYIAVTAQWNRDWRPLIYHEYLHYFLHNNFPPLPTWYDEGVAEYYSTFRATDSGASIGLIPEHHLQLLRSESMLPLEKLLAVTPASVEYNESSKQGVFYAQSWALVHLLLGSEKGRAKELALFLTLVRQGKSHEQALRDAFHTDFKTLSAELSAYVNNTTRFRYVKVKSADLRVPSETRSGRLSDSDALVHLGELLAHEPGERLGDAEGHFQAALALDPRHVGAKAGLAFVRAREGKLDEARGLLKAVLESGGGDFRAHYLYGTLLMQTLSGGAFHVGALDANQRAVVEESRRAFRKSLEINPDFGEARGALGKTYLAENAGPALEEGVRELEAAVQRLPSRKDLLLDLATLYDRKGQRDRGDELIKAAMGPEAEKVLRQRRKSRELGATFERVNKLLAEGNTDEAIAAIEKLEETADGMLKESLEEQLKNLRVAARRNRSVRQFNEAITLANKQDLEGALRGFKGVAATAEDAELAGKAKEHASQIEQMLAKRKRAGSSKAN
jgi:tetratricopeptide (TPR) repeat protein